MSDTYQDKGTLTNKIDSLMIADSIETLPIDSIFNQVDSVGTPPMDSVSKYKENDNKLYDRYLSIGNKAFVKGDFEEALVYYEYAMMYATKIEEKKLIVEKIRDIRATSINQKPLPKNNSSQNEIIYSKNSDGFIRNNKLYHQYVSKGNLSFAKGEIEKALLNYKHARRFEENDLILKKISDCEEILSNKSQKHSTEIELISKEVSDLGIVTTIFSDTIMIIDSIYSVKLRIGKPITLSPVEPIFNEDLNVKQAEVALESAEVIKISSEMKAELKDVYKAFEIELVSELEQGVDTTKNTYEYTQWEWAVKPIKEGNYPLKIIVAVIKNIGEKEHRNTIPVYEKSINIQSRVTYFNVIMYALGGTTTFILLFLFMKKRLTKDNTQQRINFWKAPTTDNSKKIFVIYADEDSNFADKFYTNLYSLIRGGFITLWYEKMLMASEVRAKKVNKHLNEADVVVLLMSGNFFASDYCDELVEKAIEREKQENIILIPVLIRYCTWEISKLANFEVLPKNKEPISSNQWNSQEQAIYQVITEIEGILNSRNMMRAKSK